MAKCRVNDMQLVQVRDDTSATQVVGCVGAALHRFKERYEKTTQKEPLCSWNQESYPERGFSKRKEKRRNSKRSI